MLGKKWCVAFAALVFSTASSASLMSLPDDAVSEVLAEFNSIDSFVEDVSHEGQIAIGNSLTEISDDTVTSGDNPLISNVFIDPLSFKINTGNETGVDADSNFASYGFDVGIVNGTTSSTMTFIFDFIYSYRFSAMVEDLFDDEVAVGGQIRVADDDDVTLFEVDDGVDSFDFIDSSEIAEDSGSSVFEFVLAPGEALSFFGTIDLDMLLFGNASFDTNIEASLQLRDILVVNDPTQQVPAPAAWFMLLIAAVGLAARGKRIDLSN